MARYFYRTGKQIFTKPENMVDLHMEKQHSSPPTLEPPATSI